MYGLDARSFNVALGMPTCAKVFAFANRSGCLSKRTSAMCCSLTLHDWPCCLVFARYAELYPEEVDRVFMLCPSFGLGTRAKSFGSEAEMAEWERTGAKGEEVLI